MVKTPFSPFDFIFFRDDQLQQMPDCRGHHKLIALKIILLLDKPTQGTRNVTGNRRLFGNDQFLLIDIYMLLQTQRATDEQAASVDQTTRLTGNQLFINGSGRNVCEGSVPLVRITDYEQPLNDTAVSQLVLNPKIKQYHQFYFSILAVSPSIRMTRSISNSRCKGLMTPACSRKKMNPRPSVSMISISSSVKWRIESLSANPAR